jgi:hypothetical protein
LIEVNMKHNKSADQSRKQKPGDLGVPADPLPAPNLGEMNQVQPTEFAEQATWQPYESSTAHGEPPGHIDRDSHLRDQTHHGPSKRHGDKFPTADQDQRKSDSGRK